MTGVQRKLIDDLPARDCFASQLGSGFSSATLGRKLAEPEAVFGAWQDSALWLGAIDSPTPLAATVSAEVDRAIAALHAARLRTASGMVPAPYQWAALMHLAAWLHVVGDQDRLLEVSRAYRAHLDDNGVLPMDVAPHWARSAAVWMATGSGKTLLQHATVLLANELVQRQGMAGTLLVAPNPTLADQHARELQRSGIPHVRGHADRVGHGVVQVLSLSEITTTDRSGPKGRTLADFSDRYFVIFDEGHRGTANGKVDSDTQTKVAHLSRRGYLVEFSATYGHITPKAGSRNSARNALYDHYRHRIIYAFDYAAFHQASYGKDFTISSATVAFDEERAGRDDSAGLDATISALLTVAGQRNAATQQTAEGLPLAADLHTAAPLALLVGTTVDGSKLRKSKTVGKAGRSDVEKLVGYLGWVVNPANHARLMGRVQTILETRARELGVDPQRDPWLPEGWRADAKACAEAITGDVLAGTSRLLVAATDSDDETLLMTDAGDTIGIIKVGEAFSPKSLIEEAYTSSHPLGTRVAGVDGDVALAYLYSRITQPSLFDDVGVRPAMTVMIGANMFAEGWDSERPSSIVLHDTSKTDGPRLRQMFGRGVRLTGRNRLRRREYAHVPNSESDRTVWRQQTLFVFGVNADALATLTRRFKEETAGRSRSASPTASTRRRRPRRTDFALLS